MVLLMTDDTRARAAALVQDWANDKLPPHVRWSQWLEELTDAVAQAVKERDGEIERLHAQANYLVNQINRYDEEIARLRDELQAHRYG